MFTKNICPQLHQQIMTRRPPFSKQPWTFARISPFLQMSHLITFSCFFRSPPMKYSSKSFIVMKLFRCVAQSITSTIRRAPTKCRTSEMVNELSGTKISSPVLSRTCRGTLNPVLFNEIKFK